MCLQCPVHLFLAWSVVANLPNNGVSLYLQNSIGKGYFIQFGVLGLVSVPCRN